MIDGTEVLTITAAGAAAPKAVLLLFHGCSHSAIDWWQASKNCPTCLGVWLSRSRVYTPSYTLHRLQLQVLRTSDCHG